MILAAGAASRMGTLKQLLPYRGKTLLEHTIWQVEEAGFAPIVVVVGAQAEAVMDKVGRARIEWAVNSNWQRGMGSSVVTGVTRLLEMEPNASSVALLLADQPHITAQHLAGMYAEFENSGTPILAASYAGTVGVPAIFRSSVFETLKHLAEDTGARALLRGGMAQVRRYTLPEAATDIDTPEDFAGLKY